MYERQRHNQIALILQNLNQQLLIDHECYFGGGTAIAMKYGEFRTSFDIDFLIENVQGYREIRQIVKQDGLLSLFKQDFSNVSQVKLPLVDQYGVRSAISFMGADIKFEIVLEGRIPLDKPLPEDSIAGVGTLTRTDLIAEKLLANSDRFADDSVFSRDVIDLAFMDIKHLSTNAGLEKAQKAYGPAIMKDLEQAIAGLKERPDWLDRCLDFLQIKAPRAIVLKKLSTLQDQL